MAAYDAEDSLNLSVYKDHESLHYKAETTIKKNYIDTLLCVYIYKEGGGRERGREYR